MEHETVLSQVEQARAGDEQAVACVLAHAMPAIRSAAAHAAVLEFDDAVQEGIIGLFSAIDTYRPEKGASFQTYATACIRNAVTDAVRKALRRKDRELVSPEPFEDPEDPAVQAGPEEQAETREEYSQTMQSIAERLSPLERQVLVSFLDGQSYAAIAQRLSVTPKAVDNALQRVRQKLKIVP